MKVPPFLLLILILLDRFYVPLFSALDHTRYAHVACDSV